MVAAKMNNGEAILVRVRTSLSPGQSGGSDEPAERMQLNSYLIFVNSSSRKTDISCSIVVGGISWRTTS